MQGKNNIKEPKTEQAKRFTTVIDYLLKTTKAKYIQNITKNINEAINPENISDNKIEFSGLTPSHISRYKSGEAPIPYYVIEALYKTYYINPDYLLCKSEYMVDRFAEFIDIMKSKTINEEKEKEKIKDKTNDTKRSVPLVAPIFVCETDYWGEKLIYPVIRIDQRFYKYLTKVSPEKFISSVSNSNEIINSLILNSDERKELIDDIQSQKEELKMYALIPDKVFIDLLSDKNDNYVNSIYLNLRDDINKLSEIVNNISKSSSEKEFNDQKEKIKSLIIEMNIMIKNLQ